MSLLRDGINSFISHCGLEVSANRKFCRNAITFTLSFIVFIEASEKLQLTSSVSTSSSSFSASSLISLHSKKFSHMITVNHFLKSTKKARLISSSEHLLLSYISFKFLSITYSWVCSISCTTCNGRLYQIAFSVSTGFIRAIDTLFYSKNAATLTDSFLTS